MHITDGKSHQVNVLDAFVIEPGAFYLLDRVFWISAGSLRFTRRKASL